MKQSAKIKSTLCLAVLPFDNLTGDVEKDYFSRGFAEDLITDLSRFPSLQIISSHTSLSSKLKSDKYSAEKYEVNYFLKGNLRQIGGKLRINTQLFDPFSQTVLWAERYDAPVENILEIHDSIVEKVVSALSIQIDKKRLTEIRKKDITQLEAYDCWLRGYEYLRRGTIKDDEKAREIFQHALKVDPHYGRAYAGLSLSYFNEWTCQLWDRWEETLTAAYDYALQASRYSANDHLVQVILGRVLLYRRNFDSAEIHINNALELNPNDADSLIQIASCKALLGQPEEALLLFEKSIKLNPLHYNWYNLYGATICFASGDYDRLIVLAESIPLFVSVDLPAYLAIAYAFKSNLDKAEYYISQYRKVFKEKITYGRDPYPGEEFDWVIAVNPFRKEEDVNRMIKGLELAGLMKNEKGESVNIPGDKNKNHPFVFKKLNELWIISFNNLSVQLPEVKGFIDISKLLANPDQEIHCSELMGNVTSTDSGIETIDEKAKRRYQAKIKELQEELQEAEENNDTGRAQILSDELNQIIEHLAQATGLRGKSRKLADPTDRARAAVTLRIKTAMQKIETALPSMAKHLQNNIKTGTFCTYSPENRINWEL